MGHDHKAFGTARVKIALDQFEIHNCGDVFGSGEVYFVATVNGKPFGDPKQIFEVEDGGGPYRFEPATTWTSDWVDVADGQVLELRIEAFDQDVLCDDSLGSLVRPYRRSWSLGPLPPLGGDNFDVFPTVREIDTECTDVSHDPDVVSASRGAEGDADTATVSGGTRRAWCEIHPVTPVPRDYQPLRPRVLAESPAAEEIETFAQISATAPINVVCNPPVIPILGEKDRRDATDCAFVRLTRYPRDLEVAALVWSMEPVCDAPEVEFVGGAQGDRVWIYGKAEGEALIVVKHRDVTVAHFRALVDHVRDVPCRLNLLAGPDAETACSLTPSQAQQMMQVANRYLRNLGVRLVPHADRTTSDGAKPTDIEGVFTNDVPAGVTSNTDGVEAVRMNHRTDAINIAFIRTTSTLYNNIPVRGAAVAIPTPPVQFVTDSGSPSSSWLPPTGIPPDGAATTQKMFLVAGASKYSGCFMATDGSSDVLNMGQTLAHEIGHTLFLAHRGTAYKLNPLDGDRLALPNEENVMGYGAFRQSFDIVQAKAVRLHPLLRV